MRKKGKEGYIRDLKVSRTGESNKHYSANPRHILAEILGIIGLKTSYVLGEHTSIKNELYQTMSNGLSILESHSCIDLLITTCN